jgi:hypothetical protein
MTEAAADSVDEFSGMVMSRERASGYNVRTEPKEIVE